MNGDAVSLYQRLVRFTARALRRLGFFPFTLVLLILNALVHALHLRQRRLNVEIIQATDDSPDLPRNVLLWADRTVAGPAARALDLCVRMPAHPACANLHDFFSCLLAVSRVRSVGLYWDSATLSDDLAVWGAALPAGKNLVTGNDLQDLLERSEHTKLTLPVAVARDTLTYVKRHAGASHVACLNFPEGLLGLVDEIAAQRPDIWFFDLGSPGPHAKWAANRQSLSSAGLSLHERIGLIRASDAYIGELDVLGCAAVMSGVPAVVLPLEASAARTEVLRFLSIRFS